MNSPLRHPIPARSALLRKVRSCEGLSRSVARSSVWKCSCRRQTQLQSPLPGPDLRLCVPSCAGRCPCSSAFNLCGSQTPESGWTHQSLKESLPVAVFCV